METWLCATEDFHRPGEQKIALDVFYEVNRLPGEQPLAFCRRYGWGDIIDRMVLVDYLLLNRDRHGVNLEVLKDPGPRTLRLAPLFDHGVSLVFSCHTSEELSRVDVLENRPVQCFVGSRSAQDNLSRIAGDPLALVHPLRETDRDRLFEGLDPVLPPAWQEKIWEMIWKRWCRLKENSACNISAGPVDRRD